MRSTAARLIVIYTNYSTNSGPSLRAIGADVWFIAFVWLVASDVRTRYIVSLLSEIGSRNDINIGIYGYVGVDLFS